MNPRIPPLSPDEWPEEMGAALTALRPENPRHPFPDRSGDRPKGLNLLGTLAHHPDLTAAYHTFIGHILFGSTLSPRQREILVLRVAAVRQAKYEWVQHTVLARDAGLQSDEIARVADGPDAGGWSPVEAAMLRAVDELILDAKVAAATWEVLAGELDLQQLLDLVFTVGAYDSLAMALRSCEVELDADLQKWK